MTRNYEKLQELQTPVCSRAERREIQENLFSNYKILYPVAIRRISIRFEFRFPMHRDSCIQLISELNSLCR